MFPGGKGGCCAELPTLPPSCADCLEIWAPQPPGTLRACSDLYRIALPLLYSELLKTMSIKLNRWFYILVYLREM